MNASDTFNIKCAIIAGNSMREVIIMVIQLVTIIRIIMGCVIGFDALGSNVLQVVQCTD